MRKFYICFPISTTVSSKLSWSHYLELIKIEEEPKRNFYMKETINSHNIYYGNDEVKITDKELQELMFPNSKSVYFNNRSI